MRKGGPRVALSCWRLCQVWLARKMATMSGLGFREREVRGFALVPLLVMALPLAASLIRGAPILVLLAFLALAYAAAWAVDVPVHLLLRAVKRRRLLDYVAATALVGWLPWALFAGVHWLTFDTSAPQNPFALFRWSQWSLNLMLAYTIAGCVTAALFWLIAIRERKGVPTST